MSMVTKRNDIHYPRPKVASITQGAEWGRTMQMTPEVTAKMDAVWQTLGL